MNCKWGCYCTEYSNKRDNKDEIDHQEEKLSEGALPLFTNHQRVWHLNDLADLLVWCSKKGDSNIIGFSLESLPFNARFNAPKCLQSIYIVSNTKFQQQIKDILIYGKPDGKQRHYDLWKHRKFSTACTATYHMITESTLKDILASKLQIYFSCNVTKPNHYTLCEDPFPNWHPKSMTSKVQDRASFRG